MNWRCSGAAPVMLLLGHIMSRHAVPCHLLPVPAPCHDGVRVHAGVGDGHQAGALRGIDVTVTDIYLDI